MWWGSSGKKWTDRDRLLTLALTAYEDGLCSGCGQPKDRAWDAEDAGYYDVQELVCAGCKASQQHDHGKAEPGTKTYLVYERPPELGLDHQPADKQGDAD